MRRSPTTPGQSSHPTLISRPTSDLGIALRNIFPIFLLGPSPSHGVKLCLFVVWFVIIRFIRYYTARSREDETWNGHLKFGIQNEILDGHHWFLFIRLIWKETSTFTVEDFVLYSDDHFESQLPGNTCTEGTGTPRRDCTVSSNTLVPWCPKLSAVDVTANTILERLYLFSRLTPIYALSQLSLCTHTPTTHLQAISISRFRAIGLFG